MVSAPLAWPGGKFYMRSKLIPLIEATEHKVFIDVFGGGGHIIFGKKPAAIDIYNDLDGGLVNFFKVLRGDSGTDLLKSLTLTPYARSEFDACADWLTVADPVEKARQWFVRFQQSFNAFGENWNYSKRESKRSMAKQVSGWLTQVDKKMPQCIQRLRELQIENLDFEALIKKYDHPTVLFYLDPPYIPATRVRTKTYRMEMPIEEHVRLVSVLQNIQGKAILSGYDHPLYSQLGWQRSFLGAYNKNMGYTPKGDGYSKGDEFIWLK